MPSPFFDSRQHPEMLARYRGGDAHIWEYHSSLLRLSIVVSRPGESNLYILVSGVKYVRGPIRWSNSAIELDAARTTITDASADVAIRCDLVFFAEQPHFQFDRKSLFADELVPAALLDIPNASKLTAELVADVFPQDRSLPSSSDRTRTRHWIVRVDPAVLAKLSLDAVARELSAEAHAAQTSVISDPADALLRDLSHVDGSPLPAVQLAALSPDTIVATFETAYFFHDLGERAEAAVTTRVLRLLDRVAPIATLQGLPRSLWSFLP